MGAAELAKTNALLAPAAQYLALEVQSVAQG
jgi:hypothetical protein